MTGGAAGAAEDARAAWERPQKADSYVRGEVRRGKITNDSNSSNGDDGKSRGIKHRVGIVLEGTFHVVEQVNQKKGKREQIEKRENERPSFAGRRLLETELAALTGTYVRGQIFYRKYVARALILLTKMLVPSDNRSRLRLSCHMSPATPASSRKDVPVAPPLISLACSSILDGTHLSGGLVAVDQPLAAGELAGGRTLGPRRGPLPPGLGQAGVPPAAKIVNPFGALVEENLPVAAVQLAALFGYVFFFVHQMHARGKTVTTLEGAGRGRGEGGGEGESVWCPKEENTRARGERGLPTVNDTR